MVQVRDTWTRCGKRPTERHHRLTRARGGVILDVEGETYHLMDLCHEHHMAAHDFAGATENGMLLDGMVITCTWCSRPRYSGSDEYLGDRYGDEVHVSCVPEAFRGLDPGS
jgi:hypothetical protein